MENNTKILIGAGALAIAYYLYNERKAAMSPVVTTPMSPVVTTPMSPVVTTPMSPVVTTPVSPVVTTPVSPVATTPVSPVATTLVKVSPEPYVEDSIAKAKAREAIAAQIAADEAAAVAAQIEIDRLAQKAYDEENARQEAMRLANQKAYQAMLQAEADRKAAENKIIADRQKAIDEAAAAEAARQKAMNDLMYNCPEGFEFYEYRCLPTNIIVEEKANRGEGLILRDFQNNTTKLVQTCPAEYVKQGINCIPRYSLSPQELQMMAMQDAGMVQTSDGQWYLDAKSAAAAQSLIDTYNSTRYSKPAYSSRQSSINDAICSIDRNGIINNPYSSSTNGMSLRQYIGQYKVTAGELSIARASCPNSIYSSGQIAGGGTDDNALGYKDYQSYQSSIFNDKKTAVEPDTKPCEVTYHDCTRNPRRETIQIPIYADCYDYQQAKPPCAPQNNEPPFGYNPFDDGSIAMKQNPNYGGGGFAY